MKPKFHVLVAVLLFLSHTTYSQNNRLLTLRTGTITTENNLRPSFIDSFNKLEKKTNNKSLVVLQFEGIPSSETRKALSANGIELLDYVSGNSYTATVKGNIELGILQQAKARSVIRLLPEQKMEAHFAKGKIPSWAVKIPGTVDVWISFPKSFTADEVIINIKKLNLQLLSSDFQRYRILSLRIAANRITELASFPFVEYVQPAPPHDQPLNNGSRYDSRANILNAQISDGGKGLNGEGVTVGIGDNADVQEHKDFAGRLINRAVEPFQGHGTHTTGTMAGAGNINETYRGYASKSTIVSQSFNGILNNAPTYVHDYNMVVTNNSYGNVIDCDFYGTYDLYSQIMDQMAIDFPHLQNIFAAGNSGNSTCTPFGMGYGTVLGSYQSAKNVISVGATDGSGVLGYYSSRGPVKDGRTKPDIMAKGYGVGSTWPINTYNSLDGTSQAAPAVTGGLALMYQRYRQLNGNADPENGLMKAVLCNGANDKGNAGPDYQFGYGWMNLLRSVDMIENHHYFISNVANGNVNTHTITVPANTAQLKIMLYWNDPAASILSTRTLVNDLDLQVSDPSSSVHLPYILDTTAANLANPATTGADHINNMEQVVINNPSAGTYNIKVNGTAITQNPSQQYFVVYDAIPVQLKVTSPIAGERLQPANYTGAMVISWDANGFPTGTATLEFSSDNGGTWSTIQTGVDINSSPYYWTVPAIATTQALIRITKEGSGESGTGSAFTILDRPFITLDPIQCEGYINMNWTAVAGATDYELLMLQGSDMKVVGTTTTTSYIFSGLSKDSTYFVSVRARLNGLPGISGIAVNRQPNSGNCAGSISDNDLKVDVIAAPVSGRIFTSSQLSSSSPIKINIKNLDDNAVNNFTVSYSINNGAWISEAVATPIAAGATYTHTFATTADLSVPGVYNIKAVVKNAVTDPVTNNDTLVAIIKNLDNQPLDLTTLFMDDFEGTDTSTYETATTGLDFLDRYDFTPSTSFGRLRTFVNTGIAFSGSKALTLDQNKLYAAGTINYLYGTYNFSSYNAVSNDLRLDFVFNNHGQQNNINNRVWIRGNDTQPWLEVYNLDNNENGPGIYKKTASLELSRLLNLNGQDFSPSFQVRWGQFGQLPATDLGLSAQGVSAGYTFDNIRLYEAINDMQMISLDAPVAASCGLTNATTIKISIRNSSSATLTNVPVKYSINNGAWVTEAIPSVNGNTIIQYAFSTKADMSMPANYSIKAVVDYSTDNFKENDTTTALIINSPIISTFPYIENFEGNNGYWYTGGQNISWEYGTPNSTKINRAASGAKAWKTRLAGNYNDYELSYLYSPCFNTAGLVNPYLSFNVALDLEDCGTSLCDGAWVEYSADGITWSKLGVAGSGTNWYNKSTDQLWSIRDYSRWHVASIPLPTGYNSLHIRFVFQSDPATNYEGIAVDDIHIYDKTYSIYDSTTITTPVTQTISGTNWMNFISNGKIVASVNPNNQNLGVTNVQAFINSSGVRHTATQYYHDRNITIKPATVYPVDSVSIRFYFLDTETDSMIFATTCPACSNISSVCDLGVSKYTDSDTSLENGTISDNATGIWNFITADKATKVPYDKGYYAEFKIKDFSEFWLSQGAFSNNIPLPVKLMNFTAQIQNGSDVLTTWSVAVESNVADYEVEVAKGNSDLQLGHFTKIGQVQSAGNTTGLRNYNFTDTEADKFGTRYYRLKVINLDGSYYYSPLRPVQFGEALLWQIYPNPSNGLFNLVYKLNSGEVAKLRLIDVKGSLIKEYRLTGTGQPQKLKIDLSLAGYASGVYLLQGEANLKQVFKLYKK